MIFTNLPTTNADVISVKRKQIKPQHENEQEDIENGKITVQIKKVNEVKC